MSLSYAQKAQIVGTLNSALIAQLNGALNDAAQQVLSEATNTPNHAQRLTWAANVFTRSAYVANAMCWAVLSDPNIAGAIVLDDHGNVTAIPTDAQSLTAVQNLINSFLNLP